MAGDWIKMRNNLWDDPRVSRLCDITGSSEACVIGGLYWLWAAADEHTEDGKMHWLTLGSIDRKTGIKGFGAALVEIGWLLEDEDGVTVAKFSEHNGTSAKRRCADAQRKANVRKMSASNADILRTDGGQKADACGQGAELEKRREDIIPPNPQRGKSRAESPEFDLFWAAYPNKVAKDKARISFGRQGCTEIIDAILAAIEREKRSPGWTKDGGQFIPHPTTWLNQRRWESELVAPGKAPVLAEILDSGAAIAAREQSFDDSRAEMQRLAAEERRKREALESGEVYVEEAP